MSLAALPYAGWPGGIVIASVALIALIIIWTIIRVSLKSKRRSEQQRRKGG